MLSNTNKLLVTQDFVLKRIPFKPD